jgi:type IV pilus assembly protein PilM
MREYFMRKFHSFIRPIGMGFDISDRSAKFILFQEEKKVDIRTYGEIEIPEGFIQNGEIKKEDELVKFFTSWRQKEKKRLGTPPLVVSLPEEKSFLRLIQMPRLKREEISNAVRWEIEANIPLPPDELIYDHEIVEPFDPVADHFDVVITAFPKGIIESYVRVFKAAGFTLLALELESQAIVRAVVPDMRERLARVVIDMGRMRTSFIVVAGGSVLFTTTVEIGGLTLEDAIAKGLGESPEKAIEIKKKYGLDKKAYNGKLFLVLTPILSQLAAELQRTVEYYRHHTNHAHGASRAIGAVLLCGGDANLFGLDTYLGSVLKIPVVKADPFVGIRDRLSMLFPPIHKVASLGVTAAIGLALRELR